MAHNGAYVIAGMGLEIGGKHMRQPLFKVKEYTRAAVAYLAKKTGYHARDIARMLARELTKHPAMSLDQAARLVWENIGRTSWYGKSKAKLPNPGRQANKFKQKICKHCGHVQGYHDGLHGKCFAEGKRDIGYCPCNKFKYQWENPGRQAARKFMGEYAEAIRDTASRMRRTGRMRIGNPLAFHGGKVKPYCENCGQWQHPTKAGYLDCLNECARRGFAHKRTLRELNKRELGENPAGMMMIGNPDYSMKWDQADNLDRKVFLSASGVQRSGIERWHRCNWRELPSELKTMLINNIFKKNPAAYGK